MSGTAGRPKHRELAQVEIEIVAPEELVKDQSLGVGFLANSTGRAQKCGERIEVRRLQVELGAQGTPRGGGGGEG
jgi:hypothetical protein